MKTLNLRFTIYEFNKLKERKELTGLSWEKFFLSVVKGGLSSKWKK